PSPEPRSSPCSTSPSRSGPTGGPPPPPRSSSWRRHPAEEDFKESRIVQVIMIGSTDESLGPPAPAGRRCPARSPAGAAGVLAVRAAPPPPGRAGDLALPAGRPHGPAGAAGAPRRSRPLAPLAGVHLARRRPAAQS